MSTMAVRRFALDRWCIACLVCSLACTGWAQQDPTLPGRTESPHAKADAPSLGEQHAPVLPSARLSRQEAILRALEGNPSLHVTRFDPRIATTETAEELSLFDWSLTGALIGDESTRQLSAVQAFTFGQNGGNDDQPSSGRPPSLDQESLNLTSTLHKLWPTGTSLRLTGTIDRSSTNFTPREYRGEWNLELTQPLLDGRRRDVNLAAVRQAENRTTQSLWQLRQAVLTTVAEVERTYWDLVQAREVVRIRELGVRLAEEQLELSQDQVAAGKAVRSAVLSAEAELADRHAALIAARGDVRAVSARLRHLMGETEGASALLVPTDSPQPDPVDLDVNASIDRAVSQRPIVAVAQIDIDNAKLDEAVARDALGPTLDLVAAYGRSSLGLELADGLDHLMDDTPYDSSRIGLELTLPLSSRQERAQLERSVLSRRQAEAQVDAILAQVREEVEEAVITAETEMARIDASKRAVAARQEELRIEQDRFEVGMARAIDVLEIQRFLIQAEVDAVTATTDLNKALTDLFEAEGTLLDRRGISLDHDDTAAPPDSDSRP